MDDIAGLKNRRILFMKQSEEKEDASYLRIPLPLNFEK